MVYTNGVIQKDISISLGFFLNCRGETEAKLLKN